MKSILKILIAAIIAATFSIANAATLDDVKRKGHIQCGVSSGLPGFSSVDDKGVMQGIDAAFCRAVAAAVFGDASKVKFSKLTAKERFAALSSGEVDLLVRNTTWSMHRDTDLGLNFAGVNYYDGQGFLVKKNLGVTSAKQLNGASVCIQAGTTTELNLSDYFRSNGMKFKAITYDTSDQTRSGFEAGRCDVLTSDRSQLAAIRIGLKNPNTAVVLPEVISKEPLGPVVRQGDDQWFNIVRWVLNAQINAEELGLTSSNVRKNYANSNLPAVKRILGREGNFGGKIGLSNKWAYNVILQVGNYGEVFKRTVGSDSPLNLSRGVNALWNEGGILYAPPIR
jgi:general L-amino acid transport system substrate-binding protein